MRLGDAYTNQLLESLRATRFPLCQLSAFGEDCSWTSVVTGADGALQPFMQVSLSWVWIRILKPYWRPRRWPRP